MRTNSLLCLVLLGCAASAYAQDAAPDAKTPATDAAELREYVKRLEQRVAELEKERDWPLDQARAQPASALEQAVRSVSLSGYVEFLYSYNMRKGGAVPGRRGDALDYNQLRGSDADAYGLSFQNVQIVADKPLTTEGSTGFHVRAGYGEISKFGNGDPSFNGGGTAFDVPEAFMSWRAAFGPQGHTDLSVGKFLSCLGFESLENADNWQITRNPIACFGTPTTHTGARVTMPCSDDFTATACVVNGWDDVRNPNGGTTGIASLVYDGLKSFLESEVTFNASYGTMSHSDSTAGDKLRFFETIWTATPCEHTEFALDGIWGDATDHHWHGAAAYLRRHLTDKLWISGRAGWYADDALAADGARIVDGTIAAGYDVAKDMTVAVEWRHDYSASDGTYLSASGGPAKNQDTLTVAFLYRF